MESAHLSAGLTWKVLEHEKKELSGDDGDNTFSDYDCWTSSFKVQINSKVTCITVRHYGTRLHHGEACFSFSSAMIIVWKAFLVSLNLNQQWLWTSVCRGLSSEIYSLCLYAGLNCMCSFLWDMSNVPSSISILEPMPPSYSNFNILPYERLLSPLPSFNTWKMEIWTHVQRK